VVSGGHRDVQLAGPSEQLAVRGNDDRGVVAEPVGAVGALVQGGMDVDACLAGRARGEAVCGAAGQLLGLDPGGRGAGRVDREIATERQLLQAH